MLPAKSRLQELLDEQRAIANAPKADAEIGAKAALALVAQFPGQLSADDAIAQSFMRQLGSLMAGQDLDVLQAVLDPRRSGFSKFLPGLPEIAEVLESKMQPKLTSLGYIQDEIEKIEDAAAENAFHTSPEEREARLERWERIKAERQAVAKAVQRANPSSLEPWHATPEQAKGRVQALKNLEAMTKGESVNSDHD